MSAARSASVSASTSAVAPVAQSVASSATSSVARLQFQWRASVVRLRVAHSATTAARLRAAMWRRAGIALVVSVVTILARTIARTTVRIASSVGMTTGASQPSAASVAMGALATCAVDLLAMGRSGQPAHAVMRAASAR